MEVSTGEGFLSDRPGAREPGRERGRTPRHEIRALLRAHLAAASGYRHLTRHCAVCARLLRLAMEPVAPSRTARPSDAPDGPAGPAEPPPERQEAALRPPPTEASPEPPGTRGGCR